MHRDVLPHQQSMKAAHSVRRFRRGNAEHGRAYFGRKQKPWRQQSTLTLTTSNDLTTSGSNA